MIIQNYGYSVNFSARTKYPKLPKVELRRYINLGYTQDKIATIYNVPRHAVSRNVLVYGLQKKSVKNMDKVEQEIWRLHRNGYSLRDIKNETGESFKVITNVLDKRVETDNTLNEVMQKLNMKDEDVKKYLK